MNQTVASILERRKNKAIAVVLGYKEREVDEFLPRDVQEKLRKVILDQINDFHGLCMDIYQSLDSGEVTLNEYWLELLQDIHGAIVNDRVLANTNGI